MKANPISSSSAFTLIELLVVISIIAILAGIAMPAYQGALLNAKIGEATSKARQVGLALRIYADDHDGIYPGKRRGKDEEVSTANDAFRQLIPDYLQTEQIFAVGSSPVGSEVDNDMQSPATTLARGENHWAYVAGLTTTSNSAWPLVVDHTDGSGYYGRVETVPGGTWKGTKAIVVHADISAQAPKLRGSADKRYLPRFDDPDKNALVLQDYMGEGARLLEPVR
jgi:prepilin-type N-terminal cleavage/methylation domain-containing protein